MKCLRIADTEDHVSAEAIGNGTRLVPDGTILIVVRGMILAKDFPVAEAQRAVSFNQDLKAVTPVEGVESRFLLYWFLANKNLLMGSCDEAAHGTKRLQTDRLLSMPISLPSQPVQRRIASILSAYDDLIENNTRRIAILEEMARRMFEEWFVRLRFPGRENVRMVKSELGLVPEGWQHLSLGSLVTHHIGGGWGEEEQSDDFSVPAYVIRGTDIPDVRIASLGKSPLRYHTPSNFRSRKLQGRDIVFEVSGGSKDQPVGRAVMVGERLLSRLAAPVICASFCRLIRADTKQILPEILRLHFDYIYTSREIMQYQTQSTGISNFKFTLFLEKELILKPAASVQALFAAAVRPMLELVEALGVKNSNLRTTRDVLIPKLISGELDVSAISEFETVGA